MRGIYMSEHTINVIVVEDERLIAKNIARHIEQDNPHFKVIQTFSNGADAWDYIENTPPHVVFTDISMPVMDGIELTRRIYESKSFIKCVIITGYADFDFARSAIRYGVEDYLLKPINSEELSNTLKKIEHQLIADSGDIASAKGDSTLAPDEIVRLVKEYVKAHYREDISLNNIASDLGFSPSYLTKVFNKTEGITPSVYIRDYRMNLAKQLLSEPNSSVNAVAEAVGYADPFHFSKTFKSAFGCSPSDYRAGRMS